MLGVGIFFIKSVLQDQLRETIVIGDDIKAQIADEMKRTNNKLFVSGLSDGELVIAQRGSGDVTVAISNKEEGELYYVVGLDEVKAVDSANAALAAGALATPFGNVIDDLSECSTPDTSTANTIPVGEFGFEPINFDAATQRGRALYKITICAAVKDGASDPGAADYTTYATQSFFVEVR